MRKSRTFPDAQHVAPCAKPPWWETMEPARPGWRREAASRLPVPKLMGPSGAGAESQGMPHLHLSLDAIFAASAAEHAGSLSFPAVAVDCLALSRPTPRQHISNTPLQHTPTPPFCWGSMKTNTFPTHASNTCANSVQSQTANPPAAGCWFLFPRAPSSSRLESGVVPRPSASRAAGRRRWASTRFQQFFGNLPCPIRQRFLFSLPICGESMDLVQEANAVPIALLPCSPHGRNARRDRAAGPTEAQHAN